MPRFDPHPDRRPAIVTGASSGIGAATATALAAAGHPVVLAARRLDRLEELAATLNAAGAEAVALPLDLADAASIDAFADAATRAVGPVDVLVSNAGQVQPGAALDSDADAFARSIQINLIGTQRLASRIAPAMIQVGHGDLVFITSEVALRPRTYMAAYVAAKAGLEALVGAMRMELEGTGVRAGIVRPGQVSTEQGSDWDPAVLETVLPSWAAWGQLRHGGSLLPSHVADAVLAMISAPKGSHLPIIEVQPEAPLVVT
ncbi:SDR family oxidoreductase [soil metagenome]